MNTLDENQIIKIIDHLYDPTKHTAANHALINVFLNGWTVYKAELNADLPQNTLIKRVNRVKQMISFIETL